MGQRIRTRWIDSAEYDLGQGEPSKFTRVELLDDSVGIYRGTRSLKAYPYGATRIHTCLDPRLCNRLPANQHDHRWLPRRLHSLDQLQLRSNKPKVSHVNVFASRSVGAWGPQQRLVQRPGPHLNRTESLAKDIGRF